MIFLNFQRFSWRRSSSSRSASSACWSRSRWPWCTSSASTSTTESRWVLGVPNYIYVVLSTHSVLMMTAVCRCCAGSALTWWWRRSAARSPSSSSAPRGTAGTSCRTGSRTISRGHSDSLLSVRRTLKILDITFLQFLNPHFNPCFQAWRCSMWPQFCSWWRPECSRGKKSLGRTWRSSNIPWRGLCRYV